MEAAISPDGDMVAPKGKNVWRSFSIFWAKGRTKFTSAWQSSFAVLGRGPPPVAGGLLTTCAGGIGANAEVRQETSPAKNIGATPKHAMAERTARILLVPRGRTP